jgi:hypothetical protein
MAQELQDVAKHPFRSKKIPEAGKGNRFRDELSAHLILCFCQLLYLQLIADARHSI